MLLAEPAIVTDGTGAGVTLIFIGALVAVAGEAQLALEVTVTEIASPLFNAALEKDALLVPTGAPLTFHW